jgi:hypothetical protein
VSDVPPHSVPNPLRRKDASLAHRLRNALVEALDGRAVSLRRENGDDSRDPRTDGQTRSVDGAVSDCTGGNRPLPNVPDRYHDTALDVLAHPWSRFVFYYVRDRSHRSVSVAALADDLLDWIPDDDPRDISRSNVAEALWEHHIPALAVQGLLTVDRDAGAVRYVGRRSIDEALDAQTQWDPNELLSQS